MKRAFLFPGQGSQQVGMGRELAAAHPAARAVWEEVDEALGKPLSRLAWEGPAGELTLTENAQPAIMATSLAAARALEAEAGARLDSVAAFVAGHSLGEYAALAAVGALAPGDCARLLRARGLAMQRAVPPGAGAMAAVIGLDLDEIRSVLERSGGDGICVPANDNAPGQVTLSGEAAAVERAIPACREAGAKRAVPLAVSAPFHCPLMEPAAREMAELLATTGIRPPAVPVVSNVTARPESDPETIRNLLVEQVTAMVRWRESVLWMIESGVSMFVECGAGKVLAGLGRRIAPGCEMRGLGTLEEITAIAAEIGADQTGDRNDG